MKFSISSDTSRLTEASKGSGLGDFIWDTVAEAIQAVPGSFNLDNPPYRDVSYTAQTISSSTWTVVRYQVVNPGVRNSFAARLPATLDLRGDADSNNLVAFLITLSY